ESAFNQLERAGRISPTSALRNFRSEIVAFQLRRRRVFQGFGRDCRFVSADHTRRVSDAAGAGHARGGVAPARNCCGYGASIFAGSAGGSWLRPDLWRGRARVGFGGLPTTTADLSGCVARPGGGVSWSGAAVLRLGWPVHPGYSDSRCVSTRRLVLAWF